MGLEDAWSSNGRKSLRGIIETNGIECETAGPSTNMKAVCLSLSRLNHSCNANCDYSWNQRDSQMEVYAQTTICEGEELSISYIDLREPRQVRQQLLQDNWQFRCSCSVCLMRAHSGSDKRRLRMGELSALLYSNRNSSKKLRIAKKLLKLYRDEEFAMKLGRCSHHLFSFWLRCTTTSVVMPMSSLLEGRATSWKLATSAMKLRWNWRTLKLHRDLRSLGSDVP